MERFRDVPCQAPSRLSTRSLCAKKAGYGAPAHLALQDGSEPLTGSTRLPEPKRGLPLLAAVEGDAVFSDAEVEDLLFGVRTDPEALKPSVESLFHAWLLALDGVAFVGHTHPLAAISVLSSPYAEAYATRRLFPDQIVYCGPESVPPEEVIRIDERMDEHYRQRILRRSV